MEGVNFSLLSSSLMFLIKLMRRKERFAVHAGSTSIKCPGPGSL